MFKLEINLKDGIIESNHHHDDHSLHPGVDDTEWDKAEAIYLMPLIGRMVHYFWIQFDEMKEAERRQMEQAAQDQKTLKEARKIVKAAQKGRKVSER